MKKLQILGTGCPKCQRLAKAVETAAQHLGVEYEIEKVTEIDRIIELGVMQTPALMMDGRVLVSGRVPPPQELEAMLAACVA